MLTCRTMSTIIFSSATTMKAFVLLISRMRTLQRSCSLSTPFLYRSFHFASPSYSSSFVNLPQPDTQAIRQSALTYLQSFNPQLWYSQPVSISGQLKLLCFDNSWIRAFSKLFAIMRSIFVLFNQSATDCFAFKWKSLDGKQRARNRYSQRAWYSEWQTIACQLLSSGAAPASYSIICVTVQGSTTANSIN